jgi:hypothetical protein
MLPYRIELTESAKADLACCRHLGNAAGALHRAFEQRLIVSQIKEQLQHEPSRETGSDSREHVRIPEGRRHRGGDVRRHGFRCHPEGMNLSSRR